jgi:ADP-ribosylation factor protein 1
MTFLWKTEAPRVMMCGLNDTVKTNLLYSLKFRDQNLVTHPTIGFNHESIEINDITFTFIDIGGIPLVILLIDSHI